LPRAQKRSAADSNNPLSDTCILQNVLSYGHRLFVALVSKAWKEVYDTVASQQLAVHDEYNLENVIISCAPQMTLYSSVFASPSRVQLAHEIGLDCTSMTYELAAGKHADIATLAFAHKLGMQYTAETMVGAVKSNKLLVAQYLHSQGCNWPEQMLELVSGAFGVVRWCYEHCCEFERPEDVVDYAAESGNIELMA
jgi:hypothetical protein